MAHQSVGRRALVAVLVLSVAAVNCTSYRPIRVTPPTAPGLDARSIKLGDKVRLQLQNGGKIKLRVASLQADALTSDRGERIAFSDIAVAERASRLEGPVNPLYESIRVTAPTAPGVKARSIRSGDTLRLQLQNGRTVMLKVSVLEADALVGTKGERVPFKDIAVVEHRFSVLRVIIPVGVLIGVLVGLYFGVDWENIYIPIA